MITANIGSGYRHNCEWLPVATVMVDTGVAWSSSLLSFALMFTSPDSSQTAVCTDSVHDGVGVDAAAQPGVPIHLLVLGAEDCGLAVAPWLHELHYHAPEVVIRLVQKPFVQYEDLEGAVLPDQILRRARAHLGCPPFLFQVRDTDVAGPHPALAGLLRQSAGKVALSVM